MENRREMLKKVLGGVGVAAINPKLLADESASFTQEPVDINPTATKESGIISATGYPCGPFLRH